MLDSKKYTLPLFLRLSGAGTLVAIVWPLAPSLRQLFVSILSFGVLVAFTALPWRSPLFTLRRVHKPETEVLLRLAGVCRHIRQQAGHGEGHWSFIDDETTLTVITAPSRITLVRTSFGGSHAQTYVYDGQFFRKDLPIGIEESLISPEVLAWTRQPIEVEELEHLLYDLQRCSARVLVRR